MKRSLALLVAVLIVPPITAYAASVTSRSFVVRNTPAEPEPLDLFAQLSTEPPAPAAPPDSTEPPAFVSTEEVVMDEQDEQAGEIEPEGVDEDNGEEMRGQGEADEVEPEEMEEQDENSEQPIPPAFTDEVETEGQPATPIFTTPVSPDEVEMDEGEFVGEVEKQDGPVDDHSEEDELR